MYDVAETGHDVRNLCSVVFKQPSTINNSSNKFVLITTQKSISRFSYQHASMKFSIINVINLKKSCIQKYFLKESNEITFHRLDI